MLAEYQCVNCQSEEAKLVIAQIKEDTGEAPPSIALTKDVWVRGKLPDLGHKIKCPFTGCCNKAVRILSVPTIHIKGKVEYDWKHGESFRTQVNGEDVRFKFIDHPETSPHYQNQLANMAKRQGVKATAGLSNVHRDPKTGKPVVSVVSNVPDPLGRIERAKKAGNVEYNTKKVNTPVKRRTAKK